MMTPINPIKNIGFTFVELLITLTVTAILLVLAMPAFKNTLMNNRILSKTDELVDTLNYARSTALTQNSTVIVCPFSATGSTVCGGNWSNGIIVVSQPATGGAVLLQSIPSAPNDPTLTSLAVGGPAASSVSFDTRGLATTQANFKLCDARGGQYARSVQVLPTGFVNSATTMGLAAWDGSALTCP